MQISSQAKLPTPARRKKHNTGEVKARDSLMFPSLLTDVCPGQFRRVLPGPNPCVPQLTKVSSTHMTRQPHPGL